MEFVNSGTAEWMWNYWCNLFIELIGINSSLELVVPLFCQWSTPYTYAARIKLKSVCLIRMHLFKCANEARGIKNHALLQKLKEFVLFVKNFVVAAIL